MNIKNEICSKDMNMFMFILMAFAQGGGFQDKWLPLASPSIREYFSKE